MSASPSQARHLLFALLAFQNEFISHTQLIDAFSTWVADKSIPLDRILVHKGMITEEDRELFDRLVDKHLAKFDGDATLSLANLGGLSSVREDLERVAQADADALETIVKLPTRRVDATEFHTLVNDSRVTPATTSMPSSMSDRFRIVRQHARGGLGVVFVAEDQDLRREVAMKQIRDDRADYSEYRLKFMQEAEITGQLEHPGIVPVYALGTDPKGRPYYAMRFVRGEDLQSRIRKFHASRKSHKTSFDGPELRGLLRRFVDVCNAIQYAHERGVLHRDLKPGNVMLGKHGETLVVDWGLAKPLANPDQPESMATAQTVQDELPIGRSGTASGTETQAGTFIGTPAYAPPEQVLGQIHKLGPRSDVYSLGAILYELLTAKVPVKGTTIAELISNATSGNFPAPRSLEAGVPKPLEAICKKAMAIKPEDRYESAEQLCRDVEHWLDDSHVTAYREPLLAQMQRIVRKHPVAASWLAAVLLMGMTASAGLAAVSSSYNAQLVKKNEQIELEKAAAIAARDAADAAALAEKSARDAAVLAQHRAVSVRNFLVDIFRQPDPSRDGRKVTVYDSMVAGVRRVRRDFVNDPETAIALLTAIYQSYTGLGLYSDADELIHEVLDLRRENGLDATDAAIENRNDLGKNLKLLGRYDQAIQTHDKLYQQCLAKHGEKHPLTLQIKHDLANAYRAAGRLQDALKANQEVFRDRLQLLGERDPDVLSSQNTLANSLQAMGSFQEALDVRQRNYELRKDVLGPKHPDTLASQSNLAISLLEAGQVEKAEQMQTVAFETRQEVLGLEHPDTLASLYNLANVLMEMGRDDQAAQMYRGAIEGLKTSLSPTHPSTLSAMGGLGRILEMQGKLESAAEVLEKVHEAQTQDLGPRHPHSLATANSSASVLQRLGKTAEARRMLEDAVEQATAALGTGHEVTVDLQLTLQDVYFANDQMEQGLELCKQLVPLTLSRFGAVHPKSLKARNNLAAAYYKVGDLASALSIYQALIDDQHAALGASHPEALRTDLGALLTLFDLGNTDVALVRAEQTLAKTRRALGNSHPLSLQVMNTTGYLYLLSNRPEDAKERFREEVEIRIKKHGITDPATLLAGSYLVTAAEMVGDWNLVQRFCTGFYNELSKSASQSDWQSDFGFRLGFANSMLGQDPEAAESLMTSALQLVESNALPPAYPQLSIVEMHARLEQYYVKHDEIEKAKPSTSENSLQPKT